MGILGLVFIRSGWWLILGAVLGVLVYRNTQAFKTATGVSPWGIPPVVWGVVTVFVALFGTFLSLIAIRTTKVPGRASTPPGADGHGSGEGAGAGVHPAYDPAYRSGPTSRGAGGKPPPPPTPAWHADPSGRHQLRYWDGDAWTEHVSDAGAPGQDPL